MRILIIDDEFVSLNKMHSILSSFGRCDGATHGAQAMEMFEKAIGEGSPYDLITFDVELPDMNGIELLDKVKSREEELELGGWSSKKIIVSAHGHSKIVKAALQNGCDAYIVKPFSRDVIEQKMKSLWVS